MTTNIEITDIESARRAVEQVQHGWATHAAWDKKETSTFSAGKRKKLYAHLAGAYAVGLKLIEASAEPYFLQLYTDTFGKLPDARPGVNPWAARIQLLFGKWEDHKGEPRFVADRSAWKYSKAFRNFADRSFSPGEALERLITGKITLQKAERSDVAAYSAGDPDEVVKMARFREFVRYMPRRAKVPNGLPGSNPSAPIATGQLGVFWGIYTNGHNFEILGQMPLSSQIILKHALKQASDCKDEVEERKANQAKLEEFNSEWFSRDEKNAHSAQTALADAGLPEEAEAAAAKNPTAGFADNRARRRSQEEMLADAAAEHARVVVYPAPETLAQEETEAETSLQKPKRGKRKQNRSAGYSVANFPSSAAGDDIDTKEQHSAQA